MLEIEYSFLGGCLFDPDIVGECGVHQDHFSNSICAKVFEKMKQGIVDPLLVARDTGFEKEIGLMLKASFPSGTRKQGREIISSYRKRKFGQALNMALTQLKDSDVDTVLAHITKSAEFSSDSSYKHISDVAIDIYRDMQSRHDGLSDGRFIKTGFVDFDRMTGGIERGSLVVIAGRPSMGKTAFAMNVCQKVAMTHHVCFHSIEMDQLQIGYRMTASISKLDLKKLRADMKFPAAIWSGASKATSEMQKMNLYVDDNPRRTVSQIAAQARRHKATHDVDVLMIDYLGLIETEDSNKQRYLEVADMTRTFKALAKELNCCVMLLCQLNRNADTGEPKASHLRESGSIEQDADMILMPYRYTDDDVIMKADASLEKAKILIVKNRNGATGEVPVAWIGKCASYENLARENY